MLGNLSGPTLIVIIFIVLLLFGAPKLPGLARSLGQSMRILKKEVTNDDKGEQGSDNDANSANKNTGTTRNEAADANGAEGDSAAGSGSAGSSKNE